MYLTDPSQLQEFKSGFSVVDELSQQILHWISGLVLESTTPQSISMASSSNSSLSESKEASCANYGASSLLI